MELKPGIELDALVAEKVMGWKILSHCEPGVIKHLVDENQCEVNPPKFKPYSTDIAAAWEVVNTIRSTSLGCFFLHWDRISDMWSSGFNGNVGVTEFQSDSAPHAICLAALKAVSHETD